MATSDLDQLILEAVQGSVPALELLVRHYMPTVRERVRRLAGRPVLRYYDEDELIQRVTTAIFRSIGSIELGGEPVASFERWLARVTRNAIYYYSRKIRNAFVQLDSEVMDAQAHKVPTVSAFSRRRERLERLSSAIAELPSEQREVIRLLLTGRTFDEIAVVLGSNRNTVNTRVRAARARLREILGSSSQNMSST